LNIACYVIEATERLRSVGIENPGLDAEVIIANCLNLERYQLVTWRDRVLSSEEISLIEKKIKRRLKKEPVAYIIGKKEFYGLDFLVTKDVLIPRPETELLVDMAIYWSPLNARVVDLCTGSGAIAIALKYTRSDLDVFASDISQKALKIAKKIVKIYLGKTKYPFLLVISLSLFNQKNLMLLYLIPPMLIILLKGHCRRSLILNQRSPYMQRIKDRQL
jgi:release factor glutamine methyltransferase